MKRGKKSINIGGIISAAVITIYTVFVLLDAFVIPRDIVRVEDIDVARSRRKLLFSLSRKPKRNLKPCRNRRNLPKSLLPSHTSRFIPIPIIPMRTSR